MCNETYVDMIEPYLLRLKEENKGYNFYCKSSDLHENMPLSSSVIGKALMLLYEKDKMIIWSKSRCKRTIWKTNFKE